MPAHCSYDCCMLPEAGTGDAVAFPTMSMVATGIPDIVQVDMYPGLLHVPAWYTPARYVGTLAATFVAAGAAVVDGAFVVAGGIYVAQPALLVVLESREELVLVVEGVAWMITTVDETMTVELLEAELDDGAGATATSPMTMGTAVAGQY